MRHYLTPRADSFYFGTTICIALSLCFANLSAVLGQTQVTVDSVTRRFVGGTGDLDRAQYFNHSGTLVPPGNTGFPPLLWDPNGLNTAAGRVATELDQFIATSLPEDPLKSGFFEHTALVNKIQGDYRNFVETGSRWEQLREYGNPGSLPNPNPIFVQSGRNGGFWPDWLDGGNQMPLPSNYDGYADFLNVYLEETVYGTGPGQGFLPVDKDRFYLEIMNEPQWTGESWTNVIQMHEEVTEIVKAAFPQAQIGGASCCDGYNGNPNNNWDRMRDLMDDMADPNDPWTAEMDFWSIHTYERYDVASDGSYAQATFHSPGHTAAIMDLYESYSNIKFGDPKRFAVTEYGSWNRTDMADGSYGSYPRDLQQWDLVRDIREQLLVYMDRPDRIINATPFVSPRHWQNAIPTNPDGDNVFWEQDPNGVWQETIVAKMFRMYAGVQGEYVGVSSDSPDLQALAFRDGNQVHVLLNNLEKSSQQLDLQAMLGGLGSVASASLDRTYRSGGVNTYLSNVDVTATWQSLTLDAEEGAVLTLNLAGPALYDFATDERTFYGDDVDTPLNVSGGRSKTINIGAELEDALSAKVRIAYNRETFAAGESFFVFVNNNVVTVPAGVFNYDDNDQDMVSREIDVPLNFLNDGNNEIVADFVGDGGDLLTAVLVVTRSFGDFNGSGAFDGEDLSLLAAEFGAAPAGSKYDFTEDGIVDMDDVNYWLGELRGTTAGLGDFDLDNDIDGDDVSLWQNNYGTGTHYGQGDFNLDGRVDGLDFLGVQAAYASYNATLSPALTTVPEPGAVWLAFCGTLTFCMKCER